MKNRELLKVEYEFEGTKHYSNKSILKYACSILDTKFKIYYESKTGSIYAELTNFIHESGDFCKLRISDHTIMSRGWMAAMGGANEDLVFESWMNLDDLDELMDEIKENIEDFFDRV